MRQGDWSLSDLVYQEIQANYHGLTEDELAEIIAQKGRTALRQLFADGRLERAGNGVKGDPYRYHTERIKRRI